jgi:hypothetical protein
MNLIMATKAYCLYLVTTLDQDCGVVLTWPSNNGTIDKYTRRGFNVQYLVHEDDPTLPVEHSNDNIYHPNITRHIGDHLSWMVDLNNTALRHARARDSVWRKDAVRYSSFVLGTFRPKDFDTTYAQIIRRGVVITPLLQHTYSVVDHALSLHLGVFLSEVYERENAHNAQLSGLTKWYACRIHAVCMLMP